VNSRWPVTRLRSCTEDVDNYRAPWWLPGGNLQTIWAATRGARYAAARPQFRRERWTTPDHDFVDVDWLTDNAVDSPAQHPLLVVFHGLEGSSASHYAEAFADVARKRHWACAVPHFRGCSGEINLAPRAYHSGDFAEIDWMLRRFKQQHAGPVMAVGVSLGGNALMRWAGELEGAANELVCAVSAVCSPLDLAASGKAIGEGFNRQVYTRMFLGSMVPKALQKLDQHPGLFSRQALLAARDLHAFDNIVTAPLHGFKDTEDYWARASAKPHLARIQVPALALNARNDPFVPGWSLPALRDISSSVTLWQPDQGGHVGFPAATGWPPAAHVRAMPVAVSEFLAQHLPTPA
jgi:predicted alpha/beta-fold hydrolase